MRGDSGRVVLEIDPALKRRLHARCAAEGRTLKDWFLEQAGRYLAGPEQLPLLGHGGSTGDAPAKAASDD